MRSPFLIACGVTFLVIIADVLSGCGDIEEYPKELDPIGPKQEASPTPLPTTAPSNPICEGVQSFSGGTVWKPEGDNSKTPVLIIRSEFQVPFECSVLLKDGSLAPMRFTGFANGDRQHHRLGDVRTGDAIFCEDVASRALGGFVECRDVNQTCTFAMHKNPCRRKD